MHEPDILVDPLGNCSSTKAHHKGKEISHGHGVNILCTSIGQVDIWTRDCRNIRLNFYPGIGGYLCAALDVWRYNKSIPYSIYSSLPLHSLRIRSTLQSSLCMNSCFRSQFDRACSSSIPRSQSIGIDIRPNLGNGYCRLET